MKFENRLVECKVNEDFASNGVKYENGRVMHVPLYDVERMRAAGFDIEVTDINLTGYVNVPIDYSKRTTEPVTLDVHKCFIGSKSSNIGV